MNIPCILIPALVGLICGILGYLLGKTNSKSNETVVTLQPELDACLENSKNLEAKVEDLKAKLANEKLNVSKNIQSFAGSVIAFDSISAEMALGKKVRENDLKVVEGIGPKIEELFNHAGIYTWRTLSQTPAERLQAILDGGGEKFAIHNPGTWTKQAKLAYEGKWKELKEWQDVLDGGKE